MVRASALLLLLPVVLLAACTPGGGASSSGGTTVVATDYKFDAAQVTVRANQAATITLRNTSTQIHDWTVQGLDSAVTVTANPGQTTNTTFTPTRAGTFKVVCVQPGHEQLGMVGSLVVQ